MSKIDDFVAKWQNKGYEDGETQSFWADLLHDVCSIDEPNNIIEYQKRVELDNKHKGKIDVYIPSTRVLIEQKSLGKSLIKAEPQSDGAELTPFEQAKKYSDKGVGIDDKARRIITCNFKEFYIYDMREPHPLPEIIELENLSREYPKLQFLVNKDAIAPKENTRA